MTVLILVLVVDCRSRGAGPVCRALKDVTLSKCPVGIQVRGCSHSGVNTEHDSTRHVGDEGATIHHDHTYENALMLNEEVRAEQISDEGHRQRPLLHDFRGVTLTQ